MARRTLTIVLCAAAAVMEKCDEQVLPAVYLAMGATLRATPSQLGAITFVRALAQAASSPLAGALSDSCDRTRVIAAGGALWSAFTLAIAASSSVGAAAAAAAANGVGLALAIPAVQAIVADSVAGAVRGSAFGAVGLAAGLGGMSAAFGATALARASLHGVQGWRLAFGLVAAVSAGVSLLVATLAVDPRAAADRAAAAATAASATVDGAAAAAASTDGAPLLAHAPKSTPPAPPDADPPPPRPPLRARAAAALSSFCADAGQVLAIPTFRVVVAQGVVGSMPWMALVYATLYFQLLGVPDVAAGALAALFSGACAVGGLLGGALGDAAARAAPHRGRVAVAQASVLAGVPLTLALLKGLPASAACAAGAAAPACVSAHAALLAVTGALISWCGANNSAMFADVVPPRLRGTVYAFDRSFEGAVAATATPLVGVIAERVFGFAGSLADPTAPAADAARARALANALLVCTLVPWTLCFVAYFWLYSLLPADARRAWPHSASSADLTVLDSTRGGGRGRGRGRGLGSFELQPRRGRC